MTVKTKEEVRDEFVSSVKGVANYWARLEGKTDKEKCEGTAFSILTLIDGCADMCALDISLSPHPDDKEYNESNGDDWYEDGMVINDDCHLHDLFHGAN